MACSSIYRIIAKTSKFWPTVSAISKEGKDVQTLVRESIDSLPEIVSGVKYHKDYYQEEFVNVGEYPLDALINGANGTFLGSMKDRITRLFARTEDLGPGVFTLTNKVHMTFILDTESGANVVKIISAVPVREDDDMRDELGNSKAFEIIKFWDDPERYHNNYFAQKNAYINRGVVLALTLEERKKFLKMPFSGEKGLDEKGNQIMLPFHIPACDQVFWDEIKKEEASE